MIGTLDTLSILVPESRDLDLFADLLEAEGATVERCPLLRIVDLEDFAEVDAWIDRFVRAPCDDLILMTGEGLRKLLARSEQRNRKDAFIAALTKTRTITRGPKPARVLRDLKLRPGLPAMAPTSRGVIDSLGGQDLRGRRVGVQLYPGNGGLPLIDALRERGAEVLSVTPYRYAPQTEAARVAAAIQRLADGSISMVAFTSSPQVERLVAVARDFGLEKELAQGLARARIACIGPVVAETLRARGLTDIIQPEANFHLKSLVRAIVASRATHKHSSF